MAERLDGVALRELRVRPIRDAEERAPRMPHGGAPLSGVSQPLGMALRHEAELPGGEWAALLSWSSQGVGGGWREHG